MATAANTAANTAVTLRDHLRRATRAEHDALDHDMGPLGLAPGEAFARFLAIQYAARAAIEDWIARDLSEAGGLPPPPAQTSLIERDLAELRRQVPPKVPFVPPQQYDPLGAIWALAGSSLGNRMILNKRQKAGFATPDKFLADGAMPAYFAQVRLLLSAPLDVEAAQPAVDAANAVFGAFYTAFEQVE